MTQETEDRIMVERRKQSMPPTPCNPMLELREELWQEALEGAKRSEAAMAGSTRPEWRDVQVAKLAQRLYAEHWKSDFHDVEMSLAHRGQPTIDKWTRIAEAAIELLIDEPERQFEAQLASVLGSEVVEPQAAREWREATASDWLPARVEEAA